MTDLSQKTVMEAVTELNIAVKSNSAEAKAKVEKIETLLVEQDQKSQELVMKLAAEEKARGELEARLVEAEKALARPNLPADEKANRKAEFKAVSDYLVRGDAAMLAFTPEQKAYFRTDTDVDGGYLVTGDVDATITLNLVEISPIRNFAMVQTIRSNRLSVPREDTTVTAGWVGEGQTDTAQSTKFKLDNINLNKMMVTLNYTTEALEDTFVDLEGYGARIIAEQFAKLEGAAFVDGDGTLKPEGFVDSTIVTPRNSGVADNITFDSVIQLMGDLKGAYDGRYFFNRTTMVALALMKSGTNYLWQAGNVAAGVPNSIMGQQYVIAQDMDDIAANALPIAYADLGKGYKIIEKNGLTVIRDPYTKKTSGKVETTFFRRVGGGIVQPEAIKLLKCSV